MSIIVETPFQNFTGLDGKPLTNGKVYIGQVGTDPTVFANQIPVFWDEALTIPAAQPLLTNAGYIVRFGTPARVWVSTDYSISVKNSSNVLVYFLPQIGTAEFVTAAQLSANDGATRIGYKSYVANSVATTVAATLDKFIDVFTFMTAAEIEDVRNRTFLLDVTLAIQAAIDAGPYVKFPTGSYRHSRLILKYEGQVLLGEGISATVLYCPSGYAFTNYAGAETDPIGSDWVGSPTWEKMTLRGGFTHTDIFAPPTNSWAAATGRSKPFTTVNINAGLRLKRCFPYTIREVKIEHFNRGTYLAGAALARIQNFEISDCEYGHYGDNGTVWGDPAWQITTHNWMDGRFRNCWIGIGGLDHVQCQVYKKTVDFEPCNTGIAITNGGDNVWSGYFELCSEGIYRNGGSMGTDVIEDPFFAGSPGAFWGMGKSILMDSGVGASGRIVLRNGGAAVNGGGISVLGGRMSFPERERFGALVFLSPAITPPAGGAPTDIAWDKLAASDDIGGYFDASQPTRLTIPAILDGARIQLIANIAIAGDASDNDVTVSFRKNGASFAGTGSHAGVFKFGASIGIESAPVTVATGDYFTVTVSQSLARQFNTGDNAWWSIEVV